LKETSNKYLISAIIIGLLYHLGALFFTLENTYDALIHLFFGHHYAQDWFNHWNSSWYTGFNVMGYPPLVHQVIGILSLLGGLKFGLYIVAITGVVLFITGVYRFSLLVTGNRTIAGYAAILATLSSSFVETLHVFGQLPSIISISVLMHALPEIYIWLRTGKYKYLFTSLSLIAVTVSSHHVTPIFGMVFFIAPLMGMAVMDMAKEITGDYKSITLKIFITSAWSSLRKIILFGGSALFLIVFCILPYWINSKKNPITQVPIPHGSRDSFIEVTSSGLVFFIIPWGVLLFLWPYLFYRYFSKRYIFLGLSLFLLTLLGTGGTTPIPKLMLGDNAFNILTLDRFTLWASILSLPIFGEFVYRLIEGDLKNFIENKFGSVFYKITAATFILVFLSFSIFTITLSHFRPHQPQKINMQPIVNFLGQDQHDKWRFLPLGFGDQMAFLSTLTKAMTVDGNYHSARRLPELTTNAVERLENSKFRGMEGIGSLQQFLTTPEKYNLKYIFSNDKFYDPILYFCGWHRLSVLENGIMVWEKEGVKPLSEIQFVENVPDFLRIMWGILPLLSVIIAFILNIQIIWYQALKTKLLYKPDFTKYYLKLKPFSRSLFFSMIIWILIVIMGFAFGTYKLYFYAKPQLKPDTTVEAYYNALDFKSFDKAFQMIKPNVNFPKSQFMLEIAVSDGLLNSYGKLESVRTTIVKSTKNFALIKANSKWITPLETYYNENFYELEKINGKWYILPNKKDPDLPPDQLLQSIQNDFYKHGRRRITSQVTHHEDVLRQPVLEVLSAKLLKIDSTYMVIGEIQNIDDVPIDVSVKSILYDKNYKILAQFNAKYDIKHKLLPKEKTAFRIVFEDISWSKKDEVKPKTFNPKEINLKLIKDQIVSIDIHAEGNATTTDLYHQVSLVDVDINNKSIKGTLFNYGLEEVTVPQLIVSYFDEDKKIIYTDHHFLKEGVRIQRKQYFEYNLLDLTHHKIQSINEINFYVNGLDNYSLAKKVKAYRKDFSTSESFQKVNGKGYSYIQIELNNYIGNPR